VAARGAQGLSWVGGCFASLAPSRVLSCSPEARRFGAAKRGAAYRGAAGFSADRKALLLRTALASTLLIGHPSGHGFLCGPWRISQPDRQVGGYATYLRGGLFVDTLLSVHLMEIDTKTLGMPDALNLTNVGLRTDTGYRFGSFHGGAFIEPLATISVDWADIDGFSLGGNKVSFVDDANVRGRLGLRVGTSTQLWTGITAEPFVIGYLWSNLSGDNQATLTSTGTNFILKDNLDDVWGEISAGVNFFNPSANTSVFAKLDVTFGEDVDGVGGKAGMRVSW